MKNRLIIISITLVMALGISSIIPMFAAETEIFSNSADSEFVSEAETEAPAAPVIPDSAEAFLTFDGYQVRETDYNGLRAIFKLNLADMPTLEKDGVTVIEYGTALASTETLTKKGEELTVSKDESGEYVTLSYGKLFPIERDGVFVGKILQHNSEYVEYACTVTNFTIKTFEKDITFRGYAVLCDANGEEYVVYSDYPIEGYRSVNLGQMCDDMKADGIITSSNISYKNVVNFRAQIKEEEGWGPVWRP